MLARDVAARLFAATGEALVTMLDAYRGRAPSSLRKGGLKRIVVRLPRPDVERLDALRRRLPDGHNRGSIVRAFTAWGLALTEEKVPNPGPLPDRCAP